MRSAFLESLASVFGRRRPPVDTSLLADVRRRVMSLQNTIETIASDVKLNATVTMQTAALAAANAVSLKAQGELLSKLAAEQGVDTTVADATLAGVGEHLSALLSTTGQTGATLPGTDGAASPASTGAGAAPASAETAAADTVTGGQSNAA